VNNNACIIVNQSIVLPKNKLKNPKFDSISHLPRTYTSIDGKVMKGTEMRSKSRHGSGVRRRSPKKSSDRKDNKGI
jgi:hypothetical protein